MNVIVKIAFICCVAALFGCTPTEVVQEQLKQKIDKTGAQCTGDLIEFTQFQSSVASLDCGTTRYVFFATADSHVDPYAICAFAFGPSIKHKGTGHIVCNDDTAGDLTYDRVDDKKIKIKSMLNNGRHMDFTLEEHKDFPNKQPLPPDSVVP